MRISKKQREEIYLLSDLEAGELFKKILRAKEGQVVVPRSKLEKSLLDALKTRTRERKAWTSETIRCYKECLSYFSVELQPRDKATQDKWVKTIDELIRIDQLPAEAIVEIVKRTRNDEFWSGNFLALPKLRRKNKDGVKYIQVFYEKFKPKQKFSNDFKSEILNKLQS